MLMALHYRVFEAVSMCFPNSNGYATPTYLFLIPFISPRNKTLFKRRLGGETDDKDDLVGRLEVKLFLKV